MFTPRSSATLVVLAVFFAPPGRVSLAEDAGAATPQTPVSQRPVAPEVLILQALASNPVTSPYRFAVAKRERQFALTGRVGTKRVHDSAIQTIIALGYPVRDDLTIDTAEVYRVAARVQAGAGQPGQSYMPSVTGGYGYVYPQPLFGRLDEPFYGMEPPPVSYAPWFAGVAAREPIRLPAPGMVNQALAAPGPTVVSTPAGQQARVGTSLPEPIEMTLDPRGVAVLRGRVPSLEVRIAVGQEVARTSGVSEVVNLLQVGGNTTVATSDAPPPPPTPAFRPLTGTQPASGPRAGPVPAPAADRAGIAVDGDPLARHVAQSIARRPALESLALKVTNRQGTLTLSGRAPSAYEAMLAFRTAQQTPGVEQVVDQLEFPIPDAEAPNPLRDKGRPEDVEPYLLAHVRRQLGELAHVDQVRVRGDALEVRGTVSRSDDAPRAEAALRSVPLLRGFRVEPTFVTE